jgi:nucleotide-binding universal stress UspA family protein
MRSFGFRKSPARNGTGRSRIEVEYVGKRGHGAPLANVASGVFGRRVTVPTVRRIIVGVHGSLGSLQALRFAADEARQRSVPLLAVTAWVPPGGDMAERRHPSPYLRKLWRDAAWQRLWTAFDAGLGGPPSDLQVETLAVRGDTGPVLVDTACQPDDLLIIGTGRRAGFGRMMRRSVSRYCLAHAHCPVLAVPPSALMDEMSHPLHSWHIRRHELTPDTPDI